MPVYAGRAVQLFTLILTLLAFFLCVSFWVYMEKLGFHLALFDYGLATLLTLLSGALAMTAYNFLFRPTLVVQNDRFEIQNFLSGSEPVRFRDVKKMTRHYLGLSPMLEIEYQSQSNLKRVVVAAESGKQTEILSRVESTRQHNSAG